MEKNEKKKLSLSERLEQSIAKREAKERERAERDAQRKAEYEAKQQPLRDARAARREEYNAKMQAIKDEHAERDAQRKAKYEAEKQARRERTHGIVKTTSGKVLSKTSEIRAKGIRIHETIHHIAFELSDGARMSVIAEPREAGLLMEGDVGMLTYREKNKEFFFVDFQPTSR